MTFGTIGASRQRWHSSLVLIGAVLIVAALYITERKCERPSDGYSLLELLLDDGKADWEYMTQDEDGDGVYENMAGCQNEPLSG